MNTDHTTLLNGRVVLHQSQNGLRAGMDAVLLASVVEAKRGERILDMGCGTGAVGLCVYERLRDLNLSLHGIDVQPDMIDIARRNMVENAIAQGDYSIGDITDKTLFEAQSFDHIVMNPPFYEDGKRQPSPDAAREKAFAGDLNAWVGSALHWVRHGGSVSIIHRADALDQILSLVYGKFGAMDIWPVHSKPTEPAIRVIVKMIRNRKTPLTMHPPIILFDDNGEPSSQANNILRDGAGLIS